MCTEGASYPTEVKLAKAGERLEIRKKMHILLIESNKGNLESGTPSL